MTCTPVWQTWETFLAHNRTPPYISSEPDVIHGPNSFLILATYGLSELFDGAGRMDMVTEWAHCVAEATEDGENENLVLRLLCHALGEEDLVSISQMITLDMDSPWMDDTLWVLGQCRRSFLIGPKDGQGYACMGSFLIPISLDIINPRLR